MGKISIQVLELSGWQLTLQEEAGNCWEPGILNFNWRTLIRPGLLIHSGILLTKSSLTTDCGFVHKQSRPAEPNNIVSLHPDSDLDVNTGRFTEAGDIV